MKTSHTVVNISGPSVIVVVAAAAADDDDIFVIVVCLISKRNVFANEFVDEHENPMSGGNDAR